MEFGSLLMNGFLFSLQLKKIHTYALFREWKEQRHACKEFLLKSSDIKSY